LSVASELSSAAINSARAVRQQSSGKGVHDENAIQVATMARDPAHPEIKRRAIADVANVRA
jgi:hypothetical protein